MDTSILDFTLRPDNAAARHPHPAPGARNRRETDLSTISAFIHPAVQTVSLILGLFLLALGLRIRKSRQSGAQTARLSSLHMRLGRCFTALIAGGYLIGPIGMRYALGEPVFASAHGYFGTLALALFLGTAYLGRKLRLAPDSEDFRQIHVFCAFIAVFVSLAVAILGFQLLP